MPNSNISGGTEASANSTTQKIEDYCDTCRSKFPINSEDLYTGGPPDMVVAFFTEFVFQRVNPKQISLNTDANVQIALISEETSISSATLTQMLEEAALNNVDDGKIIKVPIGLETAKRTAAKDAEVSLVV
ncbi:hypothetical protein [Parasitella parasitica]|uniref:Uncharacterized protein n=1 Tax=Parasitella parasitica TaxID=35722 RepID=A0A0B7MVA4_9FUNG|nr:hypothetical protein [Parasitella parasitica]